MMPKHKPNGSNKLTKNNKPKGKVQTWWGKEQSQNCQEKVKKILIIFVQIKFDTVRKFTTLSMPRAIHS